MNASLIADQIGKFALYRSLDLANKIYQQKALTLAKALRLLRPKTLDLGCADGSFIKYVSDVLHGTPFGLDLPSSSIKKAKSIDVNAIVHNLDKPLPYKGNTFDLIFALEVIEHLFDTDLFLSEIHRVLKPKRFLIISTPNLASLPNRLKLFFGLYPKYLEYSKVGAGHIHLYTLPILRKQLQENGFKVKLATSPNFFNPFITKPWFPKSLRQLSMRLGDFFPSLGSHLLIVAQI